MSLRQRLLLLFALVVVIAVALVAWTVSIRTRSAFEKMDQERTAALTAQIRAEFQREGDDVGQTLSRMALRDSVQQLAFSITHGGDASQYLQEASSLAQEYQLDFLEIVQADGTIISSAQWPARFGYKRPLPTGQAEAFLKNEEIADGSALGMIAARPAHTFGWKHLPDWRQESRSQPDRVTHLYRRECTSGSIGRRARPRTRMTSSARASPSRADPGNRQDCAGRAGGTGFVQISREANDRATTQAIPLKDDAGKVAAVLLVGASRKPLLELQQHIKAMALTVAGIGMLLAIGVSLSGSPLASRAPSNNWRRHRERLPTAIGTFRSSPAVGPSCNNWRSRSTP